MCAVSIQDTKKVGGDMYTQMSCFCPQKSFHQGWYKKYLTGCLEAPWCGASGQASVHSNLYLWIKEEEFLAVYTTQPPLPILVLTAFIMEKVLEKTGTLSSKDKGTYHVHDRIKCYHPFSLGWFHQSCYEIFSMTSKIISLTKMY